ncbi:MAG: glycosyltransferase family 2 protein [bacterium]
MREFWRLMRWTLVAGQLVIVAFSLYQSAITTLGYRKRQQGIPLKRPEQLPRFGLIVCARNEEDVVARVVADLFSQDYPAELRDVLVVAHNCTDGTASAAARAGAAVLEVTAKTGKAFAVQAGAELLGRDHDFVGIFDADARVEAGLLAAIADHSDGADCLQAEAVPIADADWLAEGYGFGRKARNLFWWRPREALGLTTTITGCGWFIRPELLALYRSGQWTMTEDLELTARLVADGHHIRYVSAAQVALGEPRDLKTSVRQRSRWVRGHIGVIKGRWIRLANAAAHGDPHARDLAIYLVFPTRLLTRMGVTSAAVLAVAGAPFALPALIVWPAMAGEWAIPAWIGWRERLIKLSSGSLRLAARHSLLSLLWFPIGVWAMITARVRAWAPTPRNVETGAPNVR